ncbi:MAG: peptidase S41 [Pirellulaceae bacterium]|nr:MAG: peptidase S41 [Pirellulaceae bacterium]
MVEALESTRGVREAPGLQESRESIERNAMPQRNIYILVGMIAVCLACYVQAQRLKYGGKVATAIQLIESEYVEPVDPRELYYGAMEGMVSKLDPYSEFIAPQRYQEFQTAIEQQFGGVGMLVEGPPAVPQLTIVAPIPGTPAYEAGLEPGDVITHIDGEPTTGMKTEDATEKMRGPVGTTVRLTIQRRNRPEPIEVTLVRADIAVDSVYGDRLRADSSWDFFLEEDARIAYLRVTLFGERTAEEFRQALEAIRPQAEGLIIDLRYNPGGILPRAVEMCDMLLDEGVIVSTRGRKATKAYEYHAHQGVVFPPEIPIVVMVNGQSASASEIMAAALQDHGRAKVAGTRSFGKGTVQEIYQLENDQTALKFTTARFYRPNGQNIHRTEEMTESDPWGVQPDPGLRRELTDYEELYLQVRWRRRGDPRIMGTEEQPPAPPCAGDPQLLLVLQYLQQQLAAKHAPATTSPPAAPGANSPAPTEAVIP